MVCGTILGLRSGSWGSATSVVWLLELARSFALPPVLHVVGIASAACSGASCSLTRRQPAARRLAALRAASRAGQPAAVLRPPRRNRGTRFARSNRAAISACAACRIEVA